MNPLCDTSLGADEECARPLGHDGPHDAAFNADEWAEPDTNMKNGTTLCMTSI